MRHIYLLFTACLLSLSFAKGFAQSAAYAGLVFFGPDSANSFVSCPGGQVVVSTVTTTSGYVINVDTANISVVWGDGNSESVTATFIQGSYYNPSHFVHTYATAGNYAAIFTFADGYGNVDVDTINFIVTPNCGSIWTTVLLDMDADGSGDITQPDALIDVTGQNGVTQTVPIIPLAQTGQIVATITGVDITQSPYTLTVNPTWLSTRGFVMSPSHPVSQTLTLTPAMPFDDTAPFVVECDAANPVSQTDLAVTYAYGWGFRAGQQTGYLRFNVCNLSCSGPESANLSVTFESLLSVYTHNIPGATVTGNTLNANISVNGCIQYTVYFDVPGATPAATPLDFQVAVNPTGTTDFDLSNNTATCASEVRNSWDPNDKNSNKAEIISPAIQDELTYMIRFQNMGNDEAYHIVIKDTIDADLDLSTFTLLEYSHNVHVSIDQASRLVTFTFPNINLAAASVDEPASHGTVVYKIKENPGLPVGTEITNTAYIYFDFNPPIVTNTAYNINQEMGVKEVPADEFVAYPVPTSDYVVVSSKQNKPIESIRLVDISGKVILDVMNPASPQILDIRSIASGVYNLVIRSQGIIVNKKLMIRK